MDRKAGFDFLKGGRGLYRGRTTVGSKDLWRVLTGDGVGAVDGDAPARPNNVVGSEVFYDGGNADVVAVIADIVCGVGNGGDTLAGAKDCLRGGRWSVLRSGSRVVSRGWSWGSGWRGGGLFNGVSIRTIDTTAGAGGLLVDGETVITEGKAFDSRVIVHAM